MKNGCFSSSKKMKHIKAKFFFIKDKVDDGKMQVIDCPTKNMWADMSTKPLQEAAFKKMRAELMNCSVNYEENEEEEMSSTAGPLTVRGSSPFQTLQECVGNMVKLRRVTDRPIGVSRILKQAEPTVQRKSGE
jgi:hypothetical protein